MLDPALAVGADAPGLHEGSPRNILTAGRVARGDVSEGLEQAAGRPHGLLDRGRVGLQPDQLGDAGGDVVALAPLRDGECRLVSRNGNDLTGRFAKTCQVY